VADFLLRPDGKLVSGISLSDHFAGHIPGIAQMQMVQEKVDLLTLRIVRVDGFDEGSLSRISELVKEFFGEAMHYECDYVEDIPKTRSGKFRFAVCKVEHGLI
jgi:phenylacetate-CoA ligase